MIRNLKILSVRVCAGMYGSLGMSPTYRESTNSLIWHVLLENQCLHYMQSVYNSVYNVMNSCTHAEFCGL